MSVSQLNEAQKAAVMYNEGPSLVIAGAGSGKTRVLTYKIAYLMEVVGLKPYRIMALTFTNKAAEEMKGRIAQMVGSEKAKYLAMGTFHSQFSKILRTESQYIGLPSGFTVYDTADAKNLIKSIVKEMQLDEKTYKASVVLSRISSAKNKMVMPEQYDDAHGRSHDFMMRIPKVKDIYIEYQRRLKQAGAMDFDDMLCLTNRLFMQYPEVLEKYQNRFQYILVDEYQDTNYAQYLLLKALAAKHNRICVVGDDSQSIYAFRGADISNILYFQKQYPEAKLFKLEQNYRSTKYLVEAANSLIAHNKGRIPKKVFSENEMGDPLLVSEAYSDIEEANMVATRVQSLLRNHEETRDEIVVLYRINAQSRVLEDAFRSHGIPYKIRGGQSFYQRKIIKDVLAYMRLLVNPQDEEAFKRCINFPARGIGDTTVNKVKEAANIQQVSLFDVAANPLAFNLLVNQGTARKLVQFADAIKGIADAMDEKDAYQIAEEILQFSGIITLLKATPGVETETDLQNIDALLTGIKEYVDKRLEEEGVSPTLAEYLTEVSLLTDADTDKDDGVERVTLMTVHAAKGLEYNTVFIVGLEEELFPGTRDGETTEGIEEERRLLYVAITRAKKRCYLLYAKSRFRNGKTNHTSPSRFIAEIDTRCLSVCGKQPAVCDFTKKDNDFFTKTSYNKVRHLPGSIRGGLGSGLSASSRSIASTSRSTVSSTSANGFGTVSEVSIGQRILHERFGKGTVIHIENSADGKRIRVQFDHSGERLLLLKFAKIKLL